MVQRQFKLVRNGDYLLQYNLDEFIVPECIKEQLKGKSGKTTIDTFINCDLTIALAGVTDSLRMVDQRAYDNNSVLKGIVFKQSLIDDAPLLNTDYNSEIDPEDIVKYFERCHTIKMGRDIQGNDNTIHAYIYYGETAGDKDTKIRCRFPNDIRVDAKRNNRSYWVEKYSIMTGSQGGRHVIIDGTLGVEEF